MGRPSLTCQNKNQICQPGECLQKGRQTKHFFKYVEVIWTFHQQSYTLRSVKLIFGGWREMIAYGHLNPYKGMKCQKW